MIDKSLGQRLDRVHERWRDPVLTGLTVLLLLSMFVIQPLHAIQLIDARSFNTVITLLVTGGLVIVSRSAIPVFVVLAAASMIAATVVLRAHGGHAVLVVCLEALAWLLTGLVTIWVVARAVFAPGHVSYHRVIGAVLLYLAIGLVFVTLFTLVGVLEPGSFSGLTVGDRGSMESDLVYFSFVTLTTVGYGDIAPLHPVARSLCNVEAILGQLYPATLLARMVTLEVASKQ